MSILQKEKTWLNNNLGTAVRTLGIAIVVGFAFLFYNTTKNTITPKETKEFAKATVKVTNLSSDSGGSGVILQSNANSVVLTNKHVCGVVKYGGYIHTSTGDKYPVEAYKHYAYHDLCFIMVSGNLGVSTKVAAEEPQKYSEAIISGHPNLLPHVISKGNFSGKDMITVLMGTLPCKEEDAENIFCALFHIKPILHQYNSQLVTGIILPGSSGSGIYNTDGEISALVFAGRSSDGFSYAYAVPHSYILDFVTTGLNKNGWQYPTYTITGDVNRQETLTYKDVEQHTKDRVYERFIKNK